MSGKKRKGKETKKKEMEIIEATTTLKPAENLSPNEKWGLLFDVNYSLEIPMEDFDKN